MIEIAKERVGMDRGETGRKDWGRGGENVECGIIGCIEIEER